MACRWPVSFARYRLLVKLLNSLGPAAAAPVVLWAWRRSWPCGGLKCLLTGAVMAVRASVRGDVLVGGDFAGGLSRGGGAMSSVRVRTRGGLSPVCTRSGRYGGDL